MRTARLLLTVCAALAVACKGPEAALVPSKMDTAAFDGDYTLKPEASFPSLRRRVEGEKDTMRRKLGESMVKLMVDQYANFRIRRGVIRSGTRVVQEFSLLDGKVEGNLLRGKALWHEDVADPGDSSEVPVALRLSGNELEFAVLDDQGRSVDPVMLVRQGPG
jgi:hypothetical protein